MPPMSQHPEATLRLSTTALRGAFLGWLLIALPACGGTGRDDGERLASAAAGSAGTASEATSAAEISRVADTLVVYKTAACGCCKNWIEHMERNGFTVVAHNESLVDLNRRKSAAGVSTDLVSCHTALVGGYAVEGHVPADLVMRMLRERPRIAGLAVPGMPVGSPGMEGKPKQNDEVIAFRRDGGREVYASR
jgi:hypothetical protein